VVERVLGNMQGILMSESEVTRHSTRRGTSLRVAASALVALVVAVSPSLLLRFGVSLFFDLRVGVFFLALSLVAGGFVFTTLERPQPDWRYGVTFGFAAAVGVAALYLVAISPDEGATAGRLVGDGIVIVFLGTVLGMVGSGVAGLASRHLAAVGGKGAWLEPWHLGVAVAVLFLAFVGVTSTYPVGSWPRPVPASAAPQRLASATTSLVVLSRRGDSPTPLVRLGRSTPVKARGDPCGRVSN
jgi:hypothetical protein